VRPTGRAKVGRAVGRAASPERAPTGLVNIGPDHPLPVFVDPSGARRRRLRRLAFMVLAAVLLVVLVLWASQLGSPVRPPTTVPCTTAHAGTPAANRAACDR
jgi:hypothetical protein